MSYGLSPAASIYSLVFPLPSPHLPFSPSFERAQDDSALHVSHAVPDDFKFYYEPFYVSSDDVPKHDERFLGYGYTRNTQVQTELSTSIGGTHQLYGRSSIHTRMAIMINLYFLSYFKLLQREKKIAREIDHRLYCAHILELTFILSLPSRLAGVGDETDRLEVPRPVSGIRRALGIRRKMRPGQP